MITYLYTVHDKVAMQSGPVFEAVNDGVAVRQFRTLMRDVHDERDYALLRVGMMDHETNIIVSDEIEDITEAIATQSEGV